METDKTFDAAVESAFAAGVKFGTGYPAVEAIPEGFAHDAYDRWRERWAGLPHERPEQATEKPPQAPTSNPPRFQRGSEAGCYG